MTRLEMEPLRIEAVRGAGGEVEIEAFDADELFERASQALADKRFDDAVRDYDRLLKTFPGSRFERPALYNVGLAALGKKDYASAVTRFRALVDAHPASAEAKDGMFQLGASHAELGNWPASADVFARVLERTDLTADDRIEALARRGFAQFSLRDLDTAERTFRQTLATAESLVGKERLETDFYLGLARYQLGEIGHERFRAVALRLPEDRMRRDLDEKAGLLLAAQRMYIDTIRLGNPQWASASGYQIGALYEEFHEAFMNAPMPPELGRPDQREAAAVYREEIRKRVKILLEKAVRVHEQNLLMLERVGLKNEWGDRSKASFAKLQAMLDPAARQNGAPAGSDVEPAGVAEPGAPGASPAGAPPTPVAPDTRARPTAPPASGPDRPVEPPRPERPAPVRQIL